MVWTAGAMSQVGCLGGGIRRVQGDMRYYRNMTWEVVRLVPAGERRAHDAGTESRIRDCQNQEIGRAHGPVYLMDIAPERADCRDVAGATHRAPALSAPACPVAGGPRWRCAKWGGVRRGSLYPYT
jgi:hypothetical protein